MKLNALGVRLRILVRSPLRPVVRYLKFFGYNTSYIDGPRHLVQVGSKVGLANTLINTASGRVTIGDNCAFGYNVMLLTGRHRFHEGYRASLRRCDQKYWGGDEIEVPPDGFDIHIGEGSWIASGVIVTGGVTIGPHSIVAAGAVVVKSVPPHSVVAGVPAVVIGDTRDLEIPDLR